MKMIIWFGFVLGALSAAGKVVITEVGQKVTIKCGMEMQSQSLKWNHGLGLIYTINLRNGQHSKGKSPLSSRSKPINDRDLQIYSVEKSDAGKFTCKADTETYEHTLVVVSVSVHPSRDLLLGSEAALHCLVTEPDETSKVQWTKPDGSFENSPTVDLKPVDASHAGNWQCLVTCGDVPFRKNVPITVKGPTPKPPSNHPIPNIPGTSYFPSPNSAIDSDSTCNNCKPNHQPGTSGPVLLGLIWWIWVAIGVGSLIVIILIIVVIVMVRRIRRKKSKLLKMSKAKKSQRTKKYCQCERQTAAPKPRQGHRREKPLALPRQPLLNE